MNRDFSVNFIGALVLLLGVLGEPIRAADAPDRAPGAKVYQNPKDWRARMEAVAAKKDRQQMLGILKLPKPGPLPPSAEDPKRPEHLTQRAVSNSWYDTAGNTYVRSSWGNWSNYDEAKAAGYTLPDPLVLKNGRRVKNADTWWKQRRPEVLNDFLTEVYGKIPENTPKVRFEITGMETNALDGTAISKDIVGHIDNSSYPSAKPSIDITMYIPANAVSPVPMIVVVGGFFRGFSGASGFAGPPSHRHKNLRPASLQQVLAKGWGYACVATDPIQMDSGAGFNRGIIGLVNGGRSRKPDDWGVLAAWSWGMSRALDYFETEKSVDAKHIGIQGFSDWGKTALLAAALDQRWAIVFSSCSGAMGASLEKRNWGETIDEVAGSEEYHWMAGNFLKYGGHWEDMPVDAHELIALIAPRPVFITGGDWDQWSDPLGEFLACVGADPVYRLLGKKGLGTAEMPAPNVSLISGELAFRNHKGGHTDTVDWPVFLEFAEKYLNANEARP